MIRNLDDIMYITDGQDPFKRHLIYGNGGLGYKPTSYNMVGGTLTEDLNIIGLDKEELEKMSYDELQDLLSENYVLLEEGMNKNLTDESKYDYDQLLKETENIEKILDKREKEELEEDIEETESEDEDEDEEEEEKEEDAKRQSEEVKEIPEERKEQIDNFMNSFLNYYSVYRKYVETKKPDKYASKFLKDKYEKDKDNFKDKIKEQLEKIKNINDDEKKYLLEKNDKQLIEISTEQNFDLELPNIQIIDSEKINNDINNTVFLPQKNNILVKEAKEIKNNISNYNYSYVKDVVSKTDWDKLTSDFTKLGFVNEAFLSKNTHLLPDGNNENYKPTSQFDIYDFEGNTKFIELKTKLSTDIIQNLNDFKDFWDIYKDEKKGKTNLIKFMEDNKNDNFWIGLTVNKVKGGEGEQIPIFNEEGKIFKFINTDRSKGSKFLNNPKGAEVLFITNKGSYIYDFTKDPNVIPKKYEGGYRYELPYPIIKGEYQIPLIYLKEYKK